MYLKKSFYNNGSKKEIYLCFSDGTLEKSNAARPRKSYKWHKMNMELI